MSSPDVFPRFESPESQGVSSAQVVRFLERLRADRINMHGFLLGRNGHAVAEGYWAPYTAENLHRMYSVSKSFVSLAVGMMVDEGHVRLDDPVVKFFPDKLPAKVHPYLADSTVRDLLMMASAHRGTTYTSEDSDWAWTFFNKPPARPPGTIFSYDTSATVVLTTIVERLGGLPFLDYMRPRVLEPIGFSRDTWCIQTPEGTSWGGSGVICRLRDLARLAQLCLNGGRWGGRQLISESYIRAATACQIDNSLNGHAGYGYQIWRMKENGFAFRGMGGQFAFCFPDRDLLFACIADLQGNDPARTELISAFYQELYAPLKDEALPPDPASHRQLEETVAGLEILPLDGDVSTPAADEVGGTWYAMEENPMGILRMRLRFEGDEGVWDYANAQGENRLRFGLGRLVADRFPQANYFGERIGVRPGIRYQCLSSAAWVEPHKLNLRVLITDHYLGNLTVTFAFKGSEIAVFMMKAAEWFLEEYQGFAGGRAVGAGLPSG